MKLIDAHQMWNYAHSEIEKANKRHENDPEFKQWSSNIADLIDALAQDMPTIEAEPVKHGYWQLEHGSYGAMRCSVCLRECPLEKAQKPLYRFREELLYIASDYCPYCGAKMDLEDIDERKTD